MPRAAFLIEDRFEDSEFQTPFDRLKDAGIDCVVIGTMEGKEVRSKKGEIKVKIDISVRSALPDDFDALIIPGGESPALLRMEENVVTFLQDFARLKRPIAAISYGPQLLAAARLLNGATITCHESIISEMEHSGAHIADRNLGFVKDGMLITARDPRDSETFANAIIQSMA